MIEAVIFDLYGTLVHLPGNTQPYVTLARRSQSYQLRDALRLALTHDCAKLDDYVQLLGLPPQPDLDELEQALQNDISGAALFDDTLAVMEHLHGKRIKTAVISNLATPYKAVLCTQGLESYMDATIFSCDCGLKKPDTAIYALALDKLDVLPHNAVMVGDSYPCDVVGPGKLGIIGTHIVRSGAPDPKSNTIVSLAELLVKL